jgi:hypothetical protein
LTSRSCIQHEMMWKNWHYRMAAGCMSHDSTMKCCSKRMTGDTTKMPAPKKWAGKKVWSSVWSSGFWSGWFHITLKELYNNILNL